MNTSRDPLGLAALAQPQPQVDSWPVIAAELQRRQALRKHVPWAAAALVVLAAGFYFQAPHQQAAGEVHHAVVQQAVAPEAEPQAPGVVVESKSLEELVGLSQELESSLKRARDRVAVMPSQSLVYQVELEDMVAQVDEAINQSPESLALWSQRVNLLLDLNQIYQRELRRDYSAVASL